MASAGALSAVEWVALNGVIVFVREDENVLAVCYRWH